MVEGVEEKQDKSSNQCCAELENKNLKLKENYSKLVKVKEKFRIWAESIGEENERLKLDLEESKGLADKWKNETEKESEARVLLEREVYKLKEEIRLLELDGTSVSQEPSKLLQDRLCTAEKEINRLREFLEKEREKAAMERRNAEIEQKNASDALTKMEMGEKKVSEAQKVADNERKRAEEHRVLWEKVKTELDSVKLVLASEMSKSEASNKKWETERQNADKERKRAGLAVSEVEKLRRVLDINSKKAMIEKDHVNTLNKKLKEEKSRADNMEAALSKYLNCRKPSEVCKDKLIMSRNVDSKSNAHTGVVKGDVPMSQCMGKMILDSKDNLKKANERADLAKKKAKEKKKAAKKYKIIALEEKCRADQLSKELESCKLKLEELKNEVQVIPHNWPLQRHDSSISETDTIKLLKKQLKLEKMLVKHAKKSAEIEAFRNTLLHKQLRYLEECILGLQRRLSIFCGSSSLAGEGTHLLEKLGSLTSIRKETCSDVYHRQSVTGIDSRSDPPNRGSDQKMFKTAINSTSSYFSDRPVVGSQERGTITVATSTKSLEDIAGLKPAVSKLSDRVRKRCNEHVVSPDDNNDRSSIEPYADERKLDCHDKKQVKDVVESVINLCLEGENFNEQVLEKLTILRAKLNDEKRDTADKDVSENCFVEHAQPIKRRKTFGEGTIHPLYDPCKPKSILNANIDHRDNTAGDPDGVHYGECGQSFDDRIGDMGDNRLSENFAGNEVFSSMKLLELDNAAEEEAYNRAIARPLSPALPVVVFYEDEKNGAGNSEALNDNSLQAGASTVGDNIIPSCSNMILTEMTHGNLMCSEPDILQSKVKDVVLMNMNFEMVDYAANKNQFTSGNIESSLMPYSEITEHDGLCESRIASNPIYALKYLAVSSDNMDEQSVSRMVCAISSFKLPSILHSVDKFLQTFLDFLARAEDLLMKEKVCVFFSVMLSGTSDVDMKANKSCSNLFPSLGSFALRIHAALSDMALQRMFLDSLDLPELLSLIEDFLMQRKVFVCGDADTKVTFPGSSNVKLVLDGNTIKFSEGEASAFLLAAGGNLLASICTTFGHLNFICEMSCNVFSVHKFDAAAVLAILHAFAHICGSRYLNLGQYKIAMTLIKSLVVFLEELSPSSKAWTSGTLCPFSEGAISMEAVAVLLVEELGKHVSSDSSPHHFDKAKQLLVHGTSSNEEERNEDGLRSCVEYDANICNFIDILSLIELQASVARWDWAFKNLVNPICKMCEAPPTIKDPSSAIFILLGQLGRLGVAANGYEDSGVKKVIERLSALLRQNNSMKLPVQFSIANALLGLIPIRLEDIIKGEVRAFGADQTFPAKLIREWFLSLNHEQQQSLFKLQQAPSSDVKF